MPLIRLEGQAPLARGYERAVYTDPTNRDRLIKLLVSDEEQGRGGRVRAAFAGAFSGYRAFLLRQEYREYLRVALLDVSGQAHLPITHMYGFVQTEWGLGCSTQLVRDLSGAPAPTWHRLCQAGAVGPAEVDAMTDFARRMLFMNVRASDLTARNVALGYRFLKGQAGPYEAVLVDGFGDTHLVPIRTWSRWANTRALHRRFERLAKLAGLTWDPSARKFK